MQRFFNIASLSYFWKVREKGYSSRLRFRNYSKTTAASENELSHILRVKLSEKASCSEVLAQFTLNFLESSTPKSADYKLRCFEAPRRFRM